MARLERRGAEAEDLKQEVLRSRSFIDDQSRALASLRSEAEQEASRNSDLEREKAVLEAEKAVLEAEKAVLEAENGVLRAENAALRSRRSVRYADALGELAERLGSRTDKR